MIHRIPKFETFQKLFQNSSHIQINEVEYKNKKWVKKRKVKYIVGFISKVNNQ